MQAARLRQRDERTRRRAVRALLELDRPDVLEPLFSLLDDQDPWFSERAVVAARRWPAALTSEQLDRLTRHPEAARRRLAAELTGANASERIQRWEHLASDAEPEVRLAAVRTAAAHRNLSQTHLITALEDVDPRIRAAAAAALAQFEGSTFEDALTRAVADPHSSVALAAIRALDPPPHSAAIERALLAASRRDDAAGEAAIAARLADHADADLLADLAARPGSASRSALRAALEADPASLLDPSVRAAALTGGHAATVASLVRLLPATDADDLTRTIVADPAWPALQRARLLDRRQGRALDDAWTRLLPTLEADADPIVADAARHLRTATTAFVDGAA